MKNWRVWTAFLLVFFLGAVAGVAGGGYVMKKRIQSFQKMRSDKFVVRDKFLKRIEKKVDPSPEAMANIRIIVRNSQVELQAIRKNASIEAATIVDDTMEKIRAELTPSQQERFNILAERARKRIQRLRFWRSMTR